MAYKQISVTLCYDTDQPMNLDTVRAYVKGQPLAEDEPRPCFILWGTLNEIEDAPWVREMENMKRLAIAYGCETPVK